MGGACLDVSSPEVGVLLIEHFKHTEQNFLRRASTKLSFFSAFQCVMHSGAKSVHRSSCVKIYLCSNPEGKSRIHCDFICIIEMFSLLNAGVGTVYFIFFNRQCVGAQSSQRRCISQTQRSLPTHAGNGCQGENISVPCCCCKVVLHSPKTEATFFVVFLFSLNELVLWKILFKSPRDYLKWEKSLH